MSKWQKENVAQSFLTEQSQPGMAALCKVIDFDSNPAIYSETIKSKNGFIYQGEYA
jgi:hypothetical protein